LRQGGSAHGVHERRVGCGCQFGAVGTEEEPGSALVTLSGAVARPGVYEVPIGARLAPTPIGPDLAAHARRAVNACPLLALTLEPAGGATAPAAAPVSRALA
jgi:SLBB domain